MTPTEAGRAVIAQARQLLYDFDRLDEELNEFRVRRLGTVRLGANASSMTQFLPEDLAMFFEQHPDVRIDLTELTSDAIVQRLVDGRLELGVFADRETPLQIQTFPYRSHRLCAIVRADSKLLPRRKIAFDAISKLPIIGLEGGSSLLQLLHRRAAQALNVPVQARSFDVVCRFVQAGLGIGILPTRTAEMYAPVFGLVVLALTDDWARRETLIGVRSVETLTPSAKALFALLARGNARTGTMPPKG